MRLQFDTAAIADLAARTRQLQATWDGIWEDVRTRLTGTVDVALDAATGESLAERTARYHARSTAYAEALLARAQATGTVGLVAERTGAAMVRTLTG